MAREPSTIMSKPVVQASDSSIVLYDADEVSAVSDVWFESAYWREKNAVVGEASGRGSVLLVRNGDSVWALRHYHRGGLVARFIEDHYLWTGLERTRAFREWRLLATLHARGLPVPRPIAARVARRGVSYRSDIITAYLAGTRSLASLLDEGEVPEACWRAIGRMLRTFHDHGVYHPDLTAHNILLDANGETFLVDFDNCELRRPGRWEEAGVRRLQRSLRKVALETGSRFDGNAWRLLEHGYKEGAGERA
jgi:3-deoxy-D-manno-octulosonic acid kinase